MRLFYAFTFAIANLFFVASMYFHQYDRTKWETFTVACFWFLLVSIYFKMKEED